MRFGEFLVERKLVEVGQVVDALLSQIQQRPIDGQILLEEGKLTPAQVLKTLGDERCGKIGFVRTCIELGFFPDGMTLELDQMRARRQVPLGIILAERGVIPPTGLVAALDEFLAQKQMKATEQVGDQATNQVAEQVSEARPSVDPVAAVVAPAPPDQPDSPPVGEGNTALEKGAASEALRPHAVTEFLETYGENFVAELALSNKCDSERFGEIAIEYHALGGFGRFMGALLLSRFSTVMESISYRSMKNLKEIEASLAEIQTDAQLVYASLYRTIATEQSESTASRDLAATDALTRLAKWSEES